MFEVCPEEEEEEEEKKKKKKKKKSETEPGDEKDDAVVLRFRLTGAKLYGYNVPQMRSELRMDVDAMNRRLADAVNTSTDRPKAFVCYDTSGADGNVVLCHAPTRGTGEGGAEGQVAGNAGVLVREAEKILQTAFRNVASCACGQ